MCVVCCVFVCVCVCYLLCCACVCVLCVKSKSNCLSVCKVRVKACCCVYEVNFCVCEVSQSQNLGLTQAQSQLVYFKLITKFYIASSSFPPTTTALSLMHHPQYQPGLAGVQVQAALAGVGHPVLATHWGIAPATPRATHCPWNNRAVLTVETASMV